MKTTNAILWNVVVAVALLLAGPTSAATFSLAELAAGKSFLVGDLRFDDWNFEPGLSTVNPAIVEVETIDNPLLPGFRVNGNGELSGDDTVLEYSFSVTTTALGSRISGARLGLSGHVADPGSEIALGLVEDVAAGEIGRLELEVIVSDLFSDLADVAALPYLKGLPLEATVGLGSDGSSVSVDSYVTEFTLAGPFNVSGAVLALPGTASDSDVNDPNAPFSANDSANESQSILAPGTLGGYLNSPGVGAEGRSQTSGDTVDAFRASLADGFTATLFIAEDDGATHDLDLFLYDVADPNTPVDSSMGTEITEQVTAPQAGDYYIVVAVALDAIEAASNYLLVIGRDPTEAPMSGLSLQDEFAPGEAIVRFHEAEADGARSAVPPPSLDDRAAALGLRPRAGAAGRQMLFGLEQGGARTSAVSQMATGATKSGLEAWLPTDPETLEKLETLLLIKKLRRRADVIAADPNYKRYATRTPNDEFYPNQWHYPRIYLPQAWDITTGSSDTVVAVIDTGVLRDHPDLQGPLLTGLGSGYDFIRDPDISDDGDGIDPEWNDNGDAGDQFLLSSFHGTHVSGTIAAATNNDTGVAGINWNARIMPLRVLGVGGGFSYDIQQAVRYAAGLPNDSGTLPPRKADIMNLSLGGIGRSQTEQETYLEARDEGVIIVAAAGNDNWSYRSYPAAYDGVVSVSATDARNRKADYSNFGPTIDVAAPGGGDTADLNQDGYPDRVLSTLAEDLGVGITFQYRWYQGTSMASPHVAGVASLMMAIDPSLTPAGFDLMLSQGELTDDLGAAGRDDEFGHGIINAQKALLAVGGEPPGDAELVVNPSSLNFSVDGDSLILTVSNGGGGGLTIDDFSDAPTSWLTVTALDVDGSGLGTYTATVDRSGLPDGLYEATVSFDSLEAGSVNVSVLMAKSGIATGDAGYQYVKLVDAETRTTAAQEGVAVANGRYDFSFAGVAPGTYFLGAGSDADNDSLVCEVGEACGGYPVLSQLSPITVDQDVSGLEFVTRYLTRLPEPASAALGFVALAALGGLARRQRKEARLPKGHCASRGAQPTPTIDRNDPI